MKTTGTLSVTYKNQSKPIETNETYAEPVITNKTNANHWIPIRNQ